MLFDVGRQFGRQVAEVQRLKLIPVEFFDFHVFTRVPESRSNVLRNCCTQLFLWGVWLDVRKFQRLTDKLFQCQLLLLKRGVLCVDDRLDELLHVTEWEVVKFISAKKFHKKLKYSLVSVNSFIFRLVLQKENFVRDPHIRLLFWFVFKRDHVSRRLHHEVQQVRHAGDKASFLLCLLLNEGLQTILHISWSLGLNWLDICRGFRWACDRTVALDV